MDELQRLMTETEAANGLGNRFLWICTQRAQLLPDGGGYPDAALAPYATQLQHVLATARRGGRLQRTAAAQTWWRRTYPLLTAERAGLLGALTARAEAHVLRLSCLYALLDAQETITPEHLDAAYAVWLYAEQSARYLFGELLGDPLADDLLRMLRAAGPQGMTRTEIYKACGSNIPSARLSTVLGRLQREQLVTWHRQPTVGRPVDRFTAAKVTY
jgi:hypothetical protein